MAIEGFCVTSFKSLSNLLLDVWMTIKKLVHPVLPNIAVHNLTSSGTDRLLGARDTPMAVLLDKTN
jgi:DMSO/TMAO reductase YedYZ heme-binding membrane subunit